MLGWDSVSFVPVKGWKTYPGEAAYDEEVVNERESRWERNNSAKEDCRAFDPSEVRM